MQKVPGVRCTPPCSKRYLLVILGLLTCYPAFCQNVTVFNSGDSFTDGIYYVNGTVNGKDSYIKLNSPMAPNRRIFWGPANSWDIYIDGVAAPLYTTLLDTPDPPCSGWTVNQPSTYNPISLSGDCSGIVEVSGSLLTPLNGSFGEVGSFGGRPQFKNDFGSVIQWDAGQNAWVIDFGGLFYANGTDIALPPCTGLGIWRDLIGAGAITVSGTCAIQAQERVEVIGSNFAGLYLSSITTQINGRNLYEHATLNLFGLKPRIEWTGSEWQLSFGGTLHYTNPTNTPIPPCAGWVAAIASNPPITVGGNCSFGGIAPVDLLSFTIEETDGQAELQWQTATESNNDRFELDKSRDLIHWTPLGNIKGAGDAQDVQRYFFTDPAPRPGTWYYRLKQYDIDGLQHLEKIISLSILSKSDEIDIFPNPVQGDLQIDLIGKNTQHSENITYRVYTITGKVLLERTEPLTASPISLSTDMLSPGLYFLELQTLRQRFTKRFIKQN